MSASFHIVFLMSESQQIVIGGGAELLGVHTPGQGVIALPQ